MAKEADITFQLAEGEERGAEPSPNTAKNRVLLPAVQYVRVCCSDHTRISRVYFWPAVNINKVICTPGIEAKQSLTGQRNR
jgi:hypothetical protein